jgi:enoyl-CoA hydratase/carnithine racemase
MGLVNHCVPAAELLPQAIVHARKLADGPPVAIRWTKMALNQHLRHSMNLAMDAGLSMELLSVETDDAREAGKAFVEKRSPEFRGR